MSGLFAPKPAPVIQQAAPVAPPVTPPAPLPDSQSAASQEAARNAQLKAMDRAGRSSTILTDRNNRGSSDYSATRLGSAS